MPNQIGRCGLCLASMELRDSHLLPASLYKRARLPARQSPNPVVVAGEKAVITSKQVTARFLCAGCESRFSKLGESHVLADGPQPDGRFPLRARLEAASPVETRPDFKVFNAATVLGDQTNSFLYFAASVFWRASATTWKVGPGRTCHIELGATYVDQFRRYLLGEGGLPPQSRLFPYVSADNRAGFPTVFPCSSQVVGGWRHKFYIPGLLFILFLGDDATSRFDVGALNSSQGGFVWLSC